jgi:hypothetical protein
MSSTRRRTGAATGRDTWTFIATVGYLAVAAAFL